jgi:porphobilinogen synthase
MFPERRLRRLRNSSTVRRLVAETQLSVNDLILPMFVREGISERQAIAAMPGQYQHTLDSLVKEVHEVAELGVPAVVLFGLPEHKDAQGSQAWAPDGILQKAVREVREAMGDRILVIPDTCLDEFTDHGHCGVLNEAGDVDNDGTLALYAQMAVAQAEAGAHFVSPSGMMDGQVAVIRGALDEEGFEDVGILAYSAKYATPLFGPFREAVNVQIAGGGNRKTYQMDPPNRREALAEIAFDIAEGADIVMIKPALPYLDIIAETAKQSEVPVAAYHVSGEYAMVKAAAANGWLDGDAVAMEQLMSIKRAGADMILTYFAREVAEVLNG